ncbi:MAG: LysR family transcriptional regulator [Pseudomonadota bacterium]
MQDWDIFRYILAIRRHGGLSGAARALDVTHATVSRKLARAEAQLATKLFHRLPGGLTPTPAGEAAIARAEAAEAEFIALDLSLAGAEAGPLTITVPPLLMRGHLARDLHSFVADNPGVDLAILSDNRIYDLHRREADIAIRVSRQPAESLWGRKVADQRAGYFATQAFIDAHRPALEGGGGPVPVVRFTAWTTPVPPELSQCLPGAYSAAVSDDMPSAIELVKAGFGLTRIPLFAARAEPALCRIETLPLPAYSPIWMLTHPDLRHAPLVRQAMQFLAQRFQQAAATYREPPIAPAAPRVTGHFT